MNSEIDPKVVGLRIREIRKRLGLSMAAFAERIDQIETEKKAKSGTVSNWETGKNLPNNKRLKKIAELGGVSVSELLYGPFINYARDYITRLTYDNELSTIFGFSDENRKEIVDRTISQVLKKGIARHFYDIGEFNAAIKNFVDEMTKAAMRRKTETEFTNLGALNRSSYDLSIMMGNLEEYRDNGVDDDVYSDLESIIENANDKVNGLYEKYKDRLN